MIDNQIPLIRVKHIMKKIEHSLKDFFNMKQKSNK